MPKYIVPVAIVVVSIGLLTFSSYFLGDEQVRVVSLNDGRVRALHESYSKKIMIVTQGQHSTKGGVEIYKAGGNIYDVAAAVSFLISVERPESTGIGGGGFLLHKAYDQDPEAIDFREIAPLKATAKMFLKKDGTVDKRRSIDGVLASGVPGLVAGIIEMHEKYGKLKREEVLAPAIKLARDGFKVHAHLAHAIERRKEILKKFAGSRDIFFKDDSGETLKEGDLLIQEDLAQVLEEIADKGKAGFYEGWVAKKIVSEFKKRKGLITHKDLTSYEVKWREPVVGSYKDLEVISMPPPSSGGAHVVQVLNMLENDDLKGLGVQKPSSIHLIASAFNLAYIDRARYLGDSDFVDVPLKEITSKAYAKKLRAMITEDKALNIDFSDLDNHLNPIESEQTTHFSIMDEEGNVVVSTQTINGYLGSGMVVPGTGIVMNNEMDDFAAKVNASNLFGAVGGKNNLVAPKKRPLSSMSPTIVLKEHRPIFALGAPGGTKIITCVIQTILNYFDFELPLYESVAATRIHQQWKPNKLYVRPPGFSESTIEDLKAMGHNVEMKERPGCFIQAIAKEEKGLHGVSDPRGEGMAFGY